MNRLALLVAEQRRLRPPGNTRRVEPGDAEEGEPPLGERGKREHVHPTWNAATGRDGEVSGRVQEPAGEAGAVHLRPPRPCRLPACTAVADELPPPLDRSGLARARPPGPRVVLERLALEGRPEPGGLQPGAPGLEQLGQATPGGNACGHLQEPPDRLAETLCALRLSRVPDRTTAPGVCREANVVGARLAVAPERGVAHPGAAEERQRVDTTVQPEAGKQPLSEEPGHLLDRRPARGEPGQQEPHPPGDGARERDRSALAAGQTRVLHCLHQLGGILRRDDCEGAALDRSACLDRPAQGVHQGSGLATGSRSNHRLERRCGSAPRSGDAQPADCLGERAVRKLGEDLDAGEVRPRLERLEKRLDGGVETGIAGERHVHHEGALRGGRGPGQRAEEAHHPGGKGRSGGHLEPADGERRRPAAGQHGARGEPPPGGELDPRRGETLGADLDQPREVREPCAWSTHPLGGLGQGRGRDAAQGELVEQGLEGTEEAWAANDGAERSGPDRVHRGGEQTLNGGATADAEPGGRHHGIAQPLERPALCLALPVHGGPMTLRLGHDTAAGGGACPTSRRGRGDCPSAAWPRGDSSRRVIMLVNPIAAGFAPRRSRDARRHGARSASGGVRHCRSSGAEGQRGPRDPGSVSCRWGSGSDGHRRGGVASSGTRPIRIPRGNVGSKATDPHLACGDHFRTPS